MTAARRRPAGKKSKGRAPSGGRRPSRAEKVPAKVDAAARDDLAAAGDRSRSGSSRLAGAADSIARWAVWGVALVPAFLVSPTADDAFRLPKTVAAETLALVSLLALAVGWWSRSKISLAELARRPATVAAALLGAAVLPGAITAVEPLHWQRATTSLLIALGCLVMWSARLRPEALRRALDLLVVPAAGLALIAILQARRVLQPFAFAPGQSARYEITSLAGSVGDLAAFLVLPTLVLQAALARTLAGEGGGAGEVLALVRARGLWGRIIASVLLAALVYALLLSETLAALAAVSIASLVFWLVALPPRRRWVAALPLAGLGAAALLVPGLMHRLSKKLEEVQELDYDRILSGRPDGWKVSLEMFREHPWFGVGHGGYGSSFAGSKLALHEQGVGFWSRGRFAHFANAHNDYLEALAEWGVVGMIALAAAAVVLVLALRRSGRIAPGADRALALAGATACAVLALASFPLRIALTAYPWLLLLGWIFALSIRVEDGPADRAGERMRVPGWAWSAALCLVLAPALFVHTRALLGRLEASRIVRTTSQVAQLAMQSGAAAARPVLETNLAPLERAARLDPLAVSVPLSTGSHYLLLGDHAAAIESYRRGLAIEPRSELYMNLARALLLGGQRDQAVAAAAAAVKLDPRMDGQAVELGLYEPTRALTRSAR